MKNYFLCIGLLAALAGCAPADDAVKGKIVFQSNRDGNFEIYAMDGDGTRQQRLTNSPSNDITPRWSPDGASIAFASDRSGAWEIYTMRADGSGLAQLTSNAGTNTAPSWTKDGQKIVFISTRDINSGEAYRMNADGGGVERLTKDSTAKDGVLQTHDGKSLILSLMMHGRHKIGIASLAGTATKIVGSGDANSMSPSLSADGSTIAFTDDRTGTFQLYTMDLAAAEPVMAVKSSEPQYTPAWSGNSREIIVSKKGGLYLLSLKEGTERMLSFKGDSDPHWHSR